MDFVNLFERKTEIHAAYAFDPRSLAGIEK